MSPKASWFPSYPLTRPNLGDVESLQYRQPLGTALLTSTVLRYPTLSDPSFRVPLGWDIGGKSSLDPSLLSL